MSSERAFCRLSRVAAPNRGRFAVPEDGLCLSAFLVIRAREDRSRVLLGRLDPSAPWDHVGALDPDRVAAWKDLWMLPSCHLMLYEGPDDAARRVLRELAGLTPRPLQGPRVGSEVYASPRHPEAKHHWDLEFIFEGEASEPEVRPGPPWRELAFVPVGSLRDDEIARSQADILRQVGLETRNAGSSRARGV